MGIPGGHVVYAEDSMKSRPWLDAEPWDWELGEKKGYSMEGEGQNV